MVADAEQGQPTSLGFLNPVLYSLAGSRAFHDILPVSPSDPQVDRAVYTPGETDINKKFAPGFLVGVLDAQDPSGTDQVTAPGYDTMTGLGTPNGRAFIKGLRSGKKQARQAWAVGTVVARSPAFRCQSVGQRMNVAWRRFPLVAPRRESAHNRAACR
jgi:hypothetical protein